MAKVESKAQLDQFVQALQLHTRTAYSIQSSKAGKSQCGFVDYQCIYSGCPGWAARTGGAKAAVKRERASRKMGCASKITVHVPKARWPEFKWGAGA
jgi:hypothetical protein